MEYVFYDVCKDKNKLLDCKVIADLIWTLKLLKYLHHVNNIQIPHIFFIK